MGHARPGFFLSTRPFLCQAALGNTVCSATMSPRLPDIFCNLLYPHRILPVKDSWASGRGRMSGLQRAEWDSGVDSPPQERLGASLSWDERTPRPGDRDLDRCCALRKAALQYLQGRQPKALLSGRSRDQNGLKERSLTRRAGVGTGPPDLLGPRRPRSLRGSSRTAPESPLPGGVPEQRLRAPVRSGRDKTECGLFG